MPATMQLFTKAITEKELLHKSLGAATPFSKFTY